MPKQRIAGERNGLAEDCRGKTLAGVVVSMKRALIVLGAAITSSRSISAGRYPRKAFMGSCCVPRGTEHSTGRKTRLVVNEFFFGNSLGHLPRRKRQRLIAELSFAATPPDEDHRDQGLDRPQQRHRRMRNRPGFNSYLKVLLDEATMRLLREKTLELQTKSLREIVSDQAISETNDNDARASSKTLHTGQAAIPASNNRPDSHSLQIKPRSLESLHMTFFFGGEVLCDLSPEELIDWHSQVKKRIQQSFPTNTENPARTDAPEKSTDENWFRLQALTLFPPRRNNLIVATVEASPAWHLLYNDIRAVAEQSHSEKLRSLVQQNSFPQWKPHITLANVRVARSRDSQKRSQEHLQTILEQMDLPCGPKLYANGIAMGGPCPSQALLDWNFATARQKETAEQSEHL